MVNTFIPPNLHRESLRLCDYKNVTTSIQVLRISNIDQWYFERVVFPRQDLLFEAPQTAVLEIYSGNVTVLLTERLRCQDLQIGVASSESTTPVCQG